jgi:translation initiation factor 5B
LNILRKQKTPFIVAANKIDRLHGWMCERGRSFTESFADQRPDVRGYFEEKWWKLLGQFSEHGFNIERYDQLRDFTQSVAVVPCSAKEGEGLQDLLAISIGLAERFLEDRLRDTLGPAEGTVLEMKDERGLGKTIDVILYRGELKKGDRITLVSQDGPFQTHIKGMFQPRGMSEMRDAGDRWDSVDFIKAASGVKISGPGLENVLAGTSLRLSNSDEELTNAEALAWEEAKISFETDEEGVVLKSDTLGGLEALAFELKKLEVPIRLATIGQVNKRDLLTAQNAKDPLHRIILAFSTSAVNEIGESLRAEDSPVKLLEGEIIYHIIERLEEWNEETKRKIEEASREALVYPGKILIMRDHIFRRSNPAVVGIRVLAGRIHVGQYLMKEDGTSIGRVKSLRSGEDSMQQATQGEEVACAIRGATVGRGIDEQDVLLVDVPESHARRLKKLEMTAQEEEVLEQLIALHRKQDHFWGR